MYLFWPFYIEHRHNGCSVSITLNENTASVSTRECRLFNTSLYIYEWERKLERASPLIISLLRFSTISFTLSRSHSLWLQTAAGSFLSLQLETAVMRATCASIPTEQQNAHQWPTSAQTSVCFNGHLMGDGKISLVIKYRQKGHSRGKYCQLRPVCV